MLKSLLFIALLFTVPVVSQAQLEKILIRGDFSDKALLTFIQEIEEKHHIQFHYVNDVVKDILLSGTIKYNTPILKALEILLADQPVSFTTNAEGQIILFANKAKVMKTVEKFFKLSGQVKSKITSQPMPYVSIYIPGESKGTVSDENGMFEIRPLPKGLHLVQFSFVGYTTIAIKVDLITDLSISVALEESALKLKELLITPSMFEISAVETQLTLGKQEILHSPNMAKDIYRTLRALPGVANNDFSAKARIRGGHSDETAVSLDHLLINDPFHLEEVDGTFSIFNTDYVDELTMITGGFSAKHADRLSGIIDVKTSDVLESDRYSVSLDLLNVSLVAQKRITDKVNIFATARRGYLDFLLNDMGTDDTDVLDPRFSDFWSKVTYHANRKNAFTFNVLVGRDNFTVKDVDDFAAQLHLKNVRNNINGWINWKWFPSENLNSITTLSYQYLDKNAKFAFPENLSFDNSDKNHTKSFNLTNNSFLDITHKTSVEMGFEIKSFQSHFTYNETRYDVYNSTADDVIIEDIDINSTIDGYTGAAYVQYNWTVRDGFIVQPGLRLSSQSFSSDLKLAPRFTASYELSPSFTAKVAYGIYYQPDLHFKLRTSLFQTEPYSQNSECIHYTGSLTYSRRKTNIMLNVYYKDYNDLFDDYRFEFFNRLGGVNILDIPFNTNAATAHGAEIMWRQEYGTNSMLSISYAYAESKIRNVFGEETYRDFDQPHTIIVNNIFRLPKHWNISLLWTYHTGYPYTPTRVDFIKQRQNQEGIVLFYEAGKKNSERLPDFHSLDIRMEKTWYLGKNSLKAYLNIVNFYGRENLRSYYWYPYSRDPGSINFDRDTQVNIPFFISPGISFTLY